MEIIYCEKCGTRIDHTDLQDNTARKVESGGVLCPACVKSTPVEAPKPGTKGKPTVLPVGSRSNSSKALIPVVATAKPTSGAAERAVRRPSARGRSNAEKEKSPGGVIALGAGALLLVFGIYIASGGTHTPNGNLPKQPVASTTGFRCNFKTGDSNRHRGQPDRTCEEGLKRNRFHGAQHARPNIGGRGTRANGILATFQWHQGRRHAVTNQEIGGFSSPPIRRFRRRSASTCRTSESQSEGRQSECFGTGACRGRGESRSGRAMETG